MSVGIARHCLRPRGNSTYYAVSRSASTRTSNVGEATANLLPITLHTVSGDGPGECGCIRPSGRIRQFLVSVEKGSRGKCRCCVARNRKECLPEDGTLCHTSGDCNNHKLAAVPIRSIQDSKYLKLQLDKGHQSRTELVLSHGLLRLIQEFGDNVVKRSE